MFKMLFDILKFVLTVAIIVIPIRYFVAQPFIVQGSSMEPTFFQGDYLIVDQLSYKFREPRRGEVVIFRYPLDPSKFFIKRIIGLPGEEIIIENNEIFIKAGENQKKELAENYAHNTDFGIVGGQTDWLIKDGSYFVMGDNRSVSSDSRQWGALDKKFIVGRAWLKLWPLNKIDYLPGYYKLSL